MPFLFSQLTLCLGKNEPSSVCVRVMGATSPWGGFDVWLWGNELESLWRWHEVSFPFVLSHMWDERAESKPKTSLKRFRFT